MNSPLVCLHLLCVFGSAHVCAMTHVCGSEDKLQESVLVFCMWDLGIKLRSRCFEASVFNLLERLASPVCFPSPSSTVVTDHLRKVICL